MAKSELEGYQEDLAGFQKQLAETLQQLETRPEDEALLALKTELEEAVEAYTEIINDILKKSTLPSAAVAPAPAEQPKWSVENHPAYQDRAPPPPPPVAVEAPAHVFKVNEKVQARWKRQMFPARILSITGSSRDPTFYVQYDNFPDTASLKTDDLKPVSVPASAEAKKRKADDTPAYPTASSHVLSAEADIDPDLAEKAKREPSKVSDGPTRPAKIPKKTKNTKTLEAAKNKWQSFSAGKIGKQTKKKESMFKTGEGVNARVGFTNSGHEMRKDAPRTRHVYKPGDGAEEEY